MTWQKITKTNAKKKTMRKTNTFRELHQRAILETCDLWDIWSEWWGDMTWPKKIYLPTCLPTSTYLHPYIREHHSRACLSMTFSFLMYMGSGALLHIWYILDLCPFTFDQTDFCPSFLTLIFDPHFWPSFLTLIFYPQFWIEYWIESFFGPIQRKNE